MSTVDDLAQEMEVRLKDGVRLDDLFKEFQGRGSAEALDLAREMAKTSLESQGYTKERGMFLAAKDDPLKQTGVGLGDSTISFRRGPGNELIEVQPGESVTIQNGEPPRRTEPLPPGGLDAVIGDQSGADGVHIEEAPPFQAGAFTRVGDGVVQDPVDTRGLILGEEIGDAVDATTDVKEKASLLTDDHFGLYLAARAADLDLSDTLGGKQTREAVALHLEETYALSPELSHLALHAATMWESIVGLGAPVIDQSTLGSVVERYARDAERHPEELEIFRTGFRAQYVLHPDLREGLDDLLQEKFLPGTERVADEEQLNVVLQDYMREMEGVTPLAEAEHALAKRYRFSGEASTLLTSKLGELLTERVADLERRTAHTDGEAPRIFTKPPEKTGRGRWAWLGYGLVASVIVGGLAWAGLRDAPEDPLQEVTTAATQDVAPEAPAAPIGSPEAPGSPGQASASGPAQPAAPAQKVIPPKAYKTPFVEVADGVCEVTFDTVVRGAGVSTYVGTMVDLHAQDLADGGDRLETLLTLAASERRRDITKAAKTIAAHNTPWFLDQDREVQATIQQLTEEAVQANRAVFVTANGTDTYTKEIYDPTNPNFGETQNVLEEDKDRITLQLPEALCTPLLKEAPVERVDPLQEHLQQFEGYDDGFDPDRDSDLKQIDDLDLELPADYLQTTPQKSNPDRAQPRRGTYDRKDLVPEDGDSYLLTPESELESLVGNFTSLKGMREEFRGIIPNIDEEYETARAANAREVAALYLAHPGLKAQGSLEERTATSLELYENSGLSVREVAERQGLTSYGLRKAVRDSSTPTRMVTVFRNGRLTKASRKVEDRKVAVYRAANEQGMTAGLYTNDFVAEQAETYGVSEGRIREGLAEMEAMVDVPEPRALAAASEESSENASETKEAA